MPATQGIHHVGLTVLDIESARDFFVEALDFEVVGGRPEYPAIFVSDGAVWITLWAADPPAQAFDRRRCIGLHHLALSMPSSAALDAAYARLRDREDVRIEFAPEPLGDAGARHMIFAGPSGVRLELVWIPA